MPNHNFSDRLRGYRNQPNGFPQLDDDQKIEQAQIPDLTIHSQTPQILIGAGAVDITSAITHLVTAGVGDAITLADGAEGQEKVILTKTETNAGDTSVVTPAHFANGTTITFDAVADIIELLFSNGSWHWIGGQGVTLA